MTKRLTALVALALVAGAAGRAEAGQVLGSTAQGSLVGDGITEFHGPTTLAHPGREIDVAFTKGWVIGHADLTAMPIRVGSSGTSIRPPPGQVMVTASSPSPG